MKRSGTRAMLTTMLGILLAAFGAAALGDDGHDGRDQHDRDTLAAGRHIFRFDTCGDEDFWGGALELHKAIEGSRLGGVGAGVSPKTALAVGLKVDFDALPSSLVRDSSETSAHHLREP